MGITSGWAKFLHGLALATQVAVAVGGLLPVKWQGFVAVGVTTAQALLAIWQHNSTPAGQIIPAGK